MIKVVIFKDLQQLVQSESESGKNISPELQKLQDKPFWDWDIVHYKDKHRTYKANCCFNHIIGLPRKDGIEKPIFDEEILFRSPIRIWLP